MRFWPIDFSTNFKPHWLRLYFMFLLSWTLQTKQTEFKSYWIKFIYLSSRKCKSLNSYNIVKNHTTFPYWGFKLKILTVKFRVKTVEFRFDVKNSWNQYNKIIFRKEKKVKCHHDDVWFDSISLNSSYCSGTSEIFFIQREKLYKCIYKYLLDMKIYINLQINHNCPTCLLAKV